MSLTQNEEFKVVLLGKQYVGKTALVERLLNDRFNEGHYVTTIGSVFSTKQVKLKNGKNVSLALWDTAGEERFADMVRLYYRGAKAAIICYDVVDKDSFNRVTFWIDELRKYEENALLFICGCKKDLTAPPHNQPRKVDPSEVRRFAASCKAKFFETSSKSGENVEIMFSAIGADLYEASLGQTGEVQRGVNLSAPRSPSAKKSCACSQ